MVFEPLVTAPGHHQEVVGPELAAQLEPQRGAGGVAGQQRRGDAEARGGLAVPVFDAQQRVELAHEERGLARVGEHPLELGQVEVDEVAEGEVAAAAGHEVHAHRPQHVAR